MISKELFSLASSQEYPPINLKRKSVFSSFLFVILSTAFSGSSGTTPNWLPNQVANEPLFNVYFSNNSSKITPEADAILKIAAEHFKGRKKNSFIYIVGHTDTLGSRWHNNSLSRSRAKSALNRLMLHMNEPVQSFKITWKGEKNPPYQTKDEVQEPLNRCAILGIIDQ